MDERLPRKLAAILYADVAGYSRLTEENEDATHRVLSEYLDLISKTIESQNGQVMHYAGDAVLAKFDAVVDAISSAVTIQNEIDARNATVTDERKVQFRVGVNLGDVIEDRGDIYGDGVNIAARLEALAEPGGICVSEAARLALGSKLPLEFESIGMQEVKNIAEPIMAYRTVRKSDSESAKKESTQTTLELPDRPSIAVLPFTNLGSDPDQEYFADGVVEDIITDLSRFKELFVIARNSSFSYKGKPIKIQQVCRELRVRYVVEGSIRRAGERVRITAQLIDATDASHLWAERYDRELRDIFAVQDEIVETIVSTVVGRVARHSYEKVARKAPQDLVAYDFILQARAIVCDSAEQNRRCRELYESALQIDPRSAAACRGLSLTHSLDHNSGWTESPERSYERALSYALKAVALDDDRSEAHHRLGAERLFGREYELAEFHLDKALRLNPNNADAWAYKGMYFIYTGQPQQALTALERATRRNPFNHSWYLWFEGLAYYCARRYREAIPALRRSIDQHSKFIAPRRHLAACYAQLGQNDDAAEQARKILELDPHFSIEKLVSTLSYRDRADLEHYLDGLRKAGLPN